MKKSARGIINFVAFTNWIDIKVSRYDTEQHGANNDGLRQFIVVTMINTLH